ncbi:MAG: DNA polymerase III subunit delta [Firmicutes bacterium]|nr:DNA polymerase III subunit delta [Bacillota bacterium]
MILTATELSRQLKNKIKNVYLFFGEEAFLHTVYIERIKQNILEGPLSEFNYSLFDEDNAVFEDFAAQVDTYPQMAEKKLIVAKNTDFLTAAEYQKQIEGILANLPEYAVLIFSQQDNKKIKKSILGLIESNGAVVSLAKQELRELRPWVGRQFARLGKKISNEDAEFLISICDGSLSRLEVECNKLAAAAGDAERITAKLIDEMVYMPLEYKIFSMADKLLAKNSAEAYKMLKEFKTAKEQPVVIISLIYSQLSMLNMFRQIKQKGAEFLPSNRKFLARRLLSESARHSEKKLQDGMRKCAEYDDKIKNGLMDGWTALELIMAFLLT